MTTHNNMALGDSGKLQNIGKRLENEMATVTQTG